MKRTVLLLLILFLVVHGLAGRVEKCYHFDGYRIGVVGPYQQILLENTVQSALPGKPSIPYRTVVLLLPPGESAESVQILCEDEIAVPGSFILYPKQPPRTFSGDSSGQFLIDRSVYRQTGSYPFDPAGHLFTQYLYGYSVAICSFTPVRYNPAKKKLSFFGKVTVQVNTRSHPAAADALRGLVSSVPVRERVKNLVQNPGMISNYPSIQKPVSSYQYLIVAPQLFGNEFQPLMDMYAAKGIECRVKTTEEIYNTVPGIDNPAKIRNYIREQYLSNQIEYVLIAGNPALVPFRGFYCRVFSGGGYYTDSTIPADLYYSGMDGSYDADSDQVYAEVEDDPDLLPELSVARFPVNDTAELHTMIRKSISYQTNPVLGEFRWPLLAGEHLYANPLTLGSTYMNLLIDDHSDSGYYTHGIPSATNEITRLYDSITPSSTLWQWTTTQLLTEINRGKSFIHHVGHANYNYMMRLYTGNITNSTFSQVDGILHNFQILYTQGCNDGGFDHSDCIASKAVTIGNFLVAGVFNSRYGWFNEGTADGPSEHLQREFVSSLYNDTLAEKHIGTAHKISKIRTAPYIGLPGEWEPGAQRWVHYDCNVLGDPALEIWTDEPTSFTSVTWTGAVNTDWNIAGNWSNLKVPTSLSDVTLTDTTTTPEISTVGKAFCHDLTIENGAKITIPPGKSIIIRGSLILEPEK